MSQGWCFEAGISAGSPPVPCPNAPRVATLYAEHVHLAGADKHDWGEVTVRQLLSLPKRQVLFALAEDGSRTDAEVAERTGMKETTVGLHRRELLKEGHMAHVNFPSFEKLGCEMLVEFYGNTNPAVPADVKINAYRTFFKGVPQVYDAVSGVGFIRASSAMVSVSELTQFQDRHDAFFSDAPSTKATLFSTVFPFDISRCSYVYNFGPFLHRVFKLELPAPMSRPLEGKKVEDVTMSKAEARTFAEIIRSPTATDSEIGQVIHRSRQSVTDMRNCFLEQGLYARTVVPTLISAEFGPTAHVRLKFKPSAGFERKMSVGGDDWWTQSCYTLERDSELFGIYPFADFAEYRSLMNRFIGPFQQAGLLAAEPEIVTVSRENTVDLVECSFVPLVNRLLGSPLGRRPGGAVDEAGSTH